MGNPHTPHLSTSSYRRNRGDTIEYVGFIEAKLSFPMGTHVFETEALLLIQPTTKYQQQVPITIETSPIDMAVDSLGTLDQFKLSTSWKTVLYHSG